jgi:hypothetical protein
VARNGQRVFGDGGTSPERWHYSDSHPQQSRSRSDKGAKRNRTDEVEQQPPAHGLEILGSVRAVWKLWWF